MTNNFWHTKASNWSHACCVVSETSMLCALVINCPCTNVSFEWVLCSHLRRLVLPANGNWSPLWECFSRIVRPCGMPRIPTSCRPMIAFSIRGRGRWRRRRQVSPRWFTEPPACSRVDRVVVFFNSFERLFYSLSYLLTSRNHQFVVSSLAFPFRLNAKSGRWFNGCCAPSWFNIRMQGSEFQILSALVVTYDWFSMMSHSVYPMSDNDFLYL